MTPDAMDWNTIKHTQANTLIQGGKTETDACVSALTPFCAAPVVTLQAAAVSILPAISAGSVVLDDIARYALDEQAQVLSWLEGSGLRVRLIATTTEPLFDLVQSGRFLDTLYYRLNVMFLDLASDAVVSMVSSLFGT